MIASSLAFALLCMWFRWIVGADGGVAVLVGLEYDMGLHWVSQGSVRVGSCNGDDVVLMDMIWACSGYHGAV